MDGAVYDEFLKRLVQRCGEIVPGDPAEGAWMGPVVSKSQFDKVTGYIEIGKEEGVLALAQEAELILMDEPLSALDAITRGTLQQEIINIWNEDKRTALLITNDVDEGILMADRIIPLNPGPNATLGPEFKINIERPRDKTELNDNEEFKRVRNDIIEYLLDIGADVKTRKTSEYTLPELRPVMPGKVFRRRKEEDKVKYF